MSIYVIGLNHKTAPLALREKVYFPIDKLNLYLQDLLSDGVAHEAVLLSTCNRSELYCETTDISLALNWFCKQAAVSREELEAVLYVYQDEAAVAHIMQVACGLDSMVLGEPQILGQMKEAFSESAATGAVDALFHRLFQAVFMLAKEIRTTTSVGACPVSIASAAIHFAKQHMDLADKEILLIGAGDTSALLARYLSAYLSKPISIANRCVEKATALMAEKGGQIYGLDQLPLALTRADIVFSATGSAVPLVTREMMLAVMEKRNHHPITLIDIAVPRDIDASVAEVANVHLHCIDDLKNIIETNKKGREHAADKAREVIRARSRAFFAEISSFDKVAHTIRAYRGQVEEMCSLELAKAKQQLLQGHSPEAVLEAFAIAYTNKLLHAPSVQLRQAGVEGRFELLQLAKQLFALPDLKVKTS